MLEIITLENDESSFKNFFLAMAELGISTFSTSIFTVLILWIAISATRSPLITGFTSALLMAPLLLNIFVGAEIDRINNKKVIAIVAALLKSFSVVILLPVIYFHSATYEIAFLFTSAILFGVSIDFLVPIRAIWYQRFLKKRHYLKGMSVSSILSGICGLTGYLAAGVIIVLNIRFSIVVVMILYILSAIPIIFISNVNIIEKTKTKLTEVMKEGLRYIVSSRVVFEIIAISALSGLFLGMSDSASAVLVNKVFNLNSSYLSYTFFTITLGGILGSILTSSLKTIKSVGKKLSLIFMASGISFLFINIFMSVFTLLVVFFVVGFFSGMSTPIISAIFLGNVSQEKMGRVQGAMDTLGTSFNSISGILAGIIMTIIFPGNVFIIMAAGLIVLSILISRFKSLSKENI